ncbi:hypothetical protein FACS1894177_06580 [Bacteroidia bacterium]|nr:hypothetical protein FACS1894177_06580 [Bacteroidia bacterium]
MKQFTLTMLSLSALFALFFTSCEVNEAPKDYYLNTKTIHYLVKFDDWKLGTDDSGDYLYCTFREPLLTKPIFDNGMVIPYMELPDGTLTPLPFSDFWISDKYGKIEEQATCEIKPGEITFILKSDDHGSDPFHYLEYNFVLKLMW